MGGRTIAEAVLNISTISYWLEHKGAWYIAMLIPLYAITPVHDAICKKIKNPVYYTLVIVIIIVGISSLHFECPNVGLMYKCPLDPVLEKCCHIDLLLIAANVPRKCQVRPFQEIQRYNG